MTILAQGNKGSIWGAIGRAWRIRADLALSAALAILTATAAPACAETFRLGLLHGDEEIFAYEIGVLRLALAHAPGEHDLEVVPLAGLPQERLFRLLENGDPRFNIFFSGAALDRERRFLQVDVPITRGLLGHRVFIVREGWNAESALPCDRDALIDGYSIGSGLDWPDTDIFRSAGFDVVVGNYDSLWRMLTAKRYDLFNRGIQEVFIELEQQRRDGRMYELEPGVIIAYRFDYFFYLRRGDPHLHRIVEQGLVNAYETGAFQRHFDTHPAIRAALDRIRPDERCIIEIDNPFLSDRLKRLPEGYWHKF